MTKDTLVFVRYKTDVKLAGKNWAIIHDFGDTQVLLTSKQMYGFQRRWLIKHPFLSLISEIQIVKEK